MLELNLPEYNFKIKKKENKNLIFDEYRRKWIALTPEEWVRQRFISYLMNEMNYPATLVSIEKKVSVNGLNKRFDAVVFNYSAKPVMILEFKSPGVKISQETFDQGAVYNYALKANFLILSNGITHFCCRFNIEEKKYDFLESIPSYKELISMKF